MTDYFTPSMQRPLGQTGLLVSPLGLGTVKFGRNKDVKYPEPFQIPDDRTLTRLLELAQELGINLLDTAPAYGNSEERIGKLISTQRHDWVISTKVGESWSEGRSHYSFSREDTLKSVAQSLKRLQTDYLDIVLVHSDGRDKYIVEETDVFGTLQQLKDKGQIRAFGLSGKTLEGGLLALATSDLAMVTFNPDYPEEENIIASANDQGKGILVKKALGSGHTASPEEALEFVLKRKGVTSVIVGSIDAQHITDNVRWACKAVAALAD